MSGILDFHNHVIPGVDDGAQTAEESVRALKAMARHGVTHVVATPHFDGSLTQRGAAAEARLEELDAGWARLQAVIDQVPEITVHRGAEIMLDTATPDLSDVRLHLAGGTCVLVEFPFMTVPPESARVIAYLRAAGLIPIVAHPERYSGIQPGSNLPVAWKKAGGYLQVNGGSLLGRYGKGPKLNAEDLLARGLGDYLGSDYHTRGSPQVREYCTWLAERGGEEQVQLLTQSNPMRMLRGESPLPVMPLRSGATGWSRLLPWKR